MNNSGLIIFFGIITAGVFIVNKLKFRKLDVKSEEEIDKVSLSTLVTIALSLLIFAFIGMKYY